MKQLHEFAKFFPPLEGEDFEALKQDVKSNGLLNPIILFDNKILDGRNRERACKAVGVKPKYETFEGSEHDAFEFAVSQNVARRHLTKGQLSILAAELEEKFSKEPIVKGQPKGSSSKRAAKIFNISSDSVERAKRLKNRAPHLLAAVRSGKLTLTEASQQERGNKAEELARKETERARKKYLQEHNRQVADFLGSSKDFLIALKVAIATAERFSAPEAVVFTKRRLNETRKLMDELEGHLK